MNVYASPNNHSKTERYWSDTAKANLDTEIMQRNNSR